MKKLIIISLIIINNAFSLEIKDQTVEAQLGPGEDIVKISLLEREEHFLILEVMSTDCRTCIASMPALLKLNGMIEGQALMKTVAIDRVLDLDNIFFEEQADLIVYPFIFDSSRVVASMLEIRLTPTTLILDENNKIIYKHVGFIEDDEVEKMAALVSL